MSQNSSGQLDFKGGVRQLADGRSAVSGVSSSSGLPVTWATRNGTEILLAGRPRHKTILAETGTSAFAEALIEDINERDTHALRDLRGRFAIALRKPNVDSLLLVTDRLASVPLFYGQSSDGFIFAESTFLLPESMRSTERLSKQAIYNYLFFHAVPGPGSIYTGVSKLAPASYMRVTEKGTTTGRYWDPTFHEKTQHSFDAQAKELRELCRAAVGRFANDKQVACFLSGGLDSSTVVGFLSESRQQPVDAFTIGFDAAEYDETSYARTAAKHFSANLHEYRVTPTDIIHAVRDIVAAYDEPFGNSSAVPTLLCARRARLQGVEILLAGDGGDELFAGNARYAKQKIFETYFQVPEIIRRMLLDPIGSSRSRIAELPGIRKLASYVRQANVRLPDRTESYNHLIRYGSDSVFNDQFLLEVDPSAPMRLLRDCYNEPADASTLNRMLYLDWKFTLTDNDLRKVTRMCHLGGVNVEFPLLNDDLLEFSTQVPSNRKLPGLKLRHFFRQAMRDFLPTDVLTKRKHGFGLPFGVWLIENPELREFSYNSLARVEERDIFAPAFIETLRTAAEQEHAAYFGEMIWVIMMLEEWLSAHH